MSPSSAGFFEGGPCPFLFLRCLGEVTTLLLLSAGTGPCIDPVPQAHRTLYFTCYFVSLLERWEQHGVYPQHPAWNATESLFCTKHCSEHRVCLMPIFLSQPRIQVQVFPCFADKAAEAECD